MATNPTAYQTIYSQEYRKKKKALGLCMRCKSLAKSVSLCEVHLEEKNEYISKSRDARRSKGLCVHCGGPRPCQCKGCSRAKYDRLKSSAKRRVIKFLITRKEFDQWLNETPSACRYCGVSSQQLKMSKSSKPYLTVDRMNNDVGYCTANICLACHRCNNNKSNFFTFEQWDKIAEECIKPRLNEYHIIPEQK